MHANVFPRGSSQPSMCRLPLRNSQSSQPSMCRLPLINSQTIKEALKLIASHFQGAVAQGNMRNSISQASSRLKAPWRFFYIMRDIKRLGQDINDLIHHIPREQNQEADSSARFGVERDSLLVTNGLPF